MKRKITIPVVLRVLSIAVLGVLLSCTGRVKSTAEQIEEIEGSDAPQLTEEWISLFDGETLNGWKRYNADEIGPLWKVEDGAIMCDGRGHGEGSPEDGGSLITLETFGNFELELEWKISEGGNSGIMYHVVEKPEYSHAYVTGPEYQVMDDPEGPVSEEVANKRAGSNYDMYAAPLTKKLNPVGEWNTARIVYKDGKVEQWLNDEKVVEFDENSEDYIEKFNKSKWASGDYPYWNTYKEGSIGLQDHGAAVWYRNIRIRKL
jgi:hypothetical protein